MISMHGDWVSMGAWELVSLDPSILLQRYSYHLLFESSHVEQCIAHLLTSMEVCIYVGRMSMVS